MYELILILLLLAMSNPLAMFTCCCVSSCVIFTDAFPGSSIDASWTVVSGTWANTSNKLTTSSTSALIINSATTAFDSGHVSAAVSAATDASVVRVIGAYKDSSNYLFAEIDFATHLKIGKVVAGVETILGTTLNVGGSVPSVGSTPTLKLSWDGVRAVASTGANLVATALVTPDAAGNKIGMGTGGTASTVTFDNVEFSNHKIDTSDCNHCLCCVDFCSEGVPSSINVSIPSATFSDTSGTGYECITGCTALNGSTYTLTLQTTNATTNCSGITYGGAGCPEYLYYSSAFCTIRNAEGGQPDYQADLFVGAKIVGASTTTFTVQISIQISSVTNNPFAGGCGTVHQFTATLDLWQTCASATFTGTGGGVSKCSGNTNCNGNGHCIYNSGNLTVDPSP